MLATGMPVTSLQRYLGHEDLDTTMLYAKVADPLLQKDYYQGFLPLTCIFSSCSQVRLKLFERKWNN
jgi:hypothetical protein